MFAGFFRFGKTPKTYNKAQNSGERFGEQNLPNPLLTENDVTVCIPTCSLNEHLVLLLLHC